MFKNRSAGVIAGIIEQMLGCFFLLISILTFVSHGGGSIQAHKEFLLIGLCGLAFLILGIAIVKDKKWARIPSIVILTLFAWIFIHFSIIHFVNNIKELGMSFFHPLSLLSLLFFLPPFIFISLDIVAIIFLARFLMKEHKEHEFQENYVALPIGVMEITKIIFKSLGLLGIIFLFYIFGRWPLIIKTYVGANTRFFVAVSSLPMFILVGNLLSMYLSKRFLYKNILIRFRDIIGFLAVIFVSILILLVYTYFDCKYIHPWDYHFTKEFSFRAIENQSHFYILNCMFIWLFLGIRVWATYIEIRKNEWKNEAKSSSDKLEKE